MGYGCLDQHKKFLMEVSLSRSVQLPIELFSGKNLNSNNPIIWVWHADKIPPHIGISVHQKYFSLKASGKDYYVDIEHVVSLLKKKSISTLAFELKDVVDLDSITSVFEMYSETIPNKITCLTPIKKMLEIESVTKLSELLLELNRRNGIEKCVGFNINVDFNGLKEYDSADIHARLSKLTHE